MGKSSGHYKLLLTKLGDAIYDLTKAMKSRQGGEAACVTPALDQVLVITGKQQTVNVKHLASILQTTSGAVTQQIAALEQLGAVTRVTNDKDRREVIIQLTGKGQKLYHEIIRSRLGLFTEVFSTLDEHDLQTLLDLILKVSNKQKGENGS